MTSKPGGTHMHHNLDIFKDALFWGAMLVGVLPTALVGAGYTFRPTIIRTPSLALFIAGEFGFLILIQSRDGPGR